MKRIAIFASGSGTNAQNIINFFSDDSQAEVSLLLSNNANAFALERAKTLGVETLVFNKEQLLSPSGVLKTLQKFNIDFIVLAGFLWKIPKILIDLFEGKIVNIHPALLPKFGGKGMFGTNVHAAVSKSDETKSGITIHYVNNQYDKGVVIFQAECIILPQDTPESLADKIHALEIKHYPKIIKSLLEKNE